MKVSGYTCESQSMLFSFLFYLFSRLIFTCWRTHKLYWSVGGWYRDYWFRWHFVTIWASDFIPSRENSTVDTIQKKPKRTLSPTRAWKWLERGCAMSHERMTNRALKPYVAFGRSERTTRKSPPNLPYPQTPSKSIKFQSNQDDLKSSCVFVMS